MDIAALTQSLLYHPSTGVIAVFAVLIIAFTIWSRQRGPAFYPPRNHRFVTWLAADVLLPLMLRYWDKVVRVELDQGSVERLQALRSQRVVLCPNHPTRVEPDIAVYLSRIMHDEWNYMAAREVFDPPPIGWLLQRLGGYSVVRGTRDTDAFRTTRQLLAEGKRWLVLFPEGETLGQNDTLGLFQSGVVQFAFWALEDLAKQGTYPSLYLAPVAIKYVFLSDQRAELARTLARLERKLAIADTQGDLYARLRRVGEEVLATAERKYGECPAEDATFNNRVQHMKEVIVGKVAKELGVTMRPEVALLERIRALFNAVDRIVQEEPAGNDYERRLQNERQQHARGLYHDLWRALRFVVTFDGYVRETMTMERFMELVIRLETEVFGRSRWRGPRKAVVQVGAPIDLTARWEEYQADKRGTVTTVTRELEHAVRAMLHELSRHSTPLATSGTVLSDR